MVFVVRVAPRQKWITSDLKLKRLLVRTILPQLREVLHPSATPGLKREGGHLPDLMVSKIGGKGRAFQRGLKH